MEKMGISGGCINAIRDIAKAQIENGDEKGALNSIKAIMEIAREE